MADLSEAAKVKACELALAVDANYPAKFSAIGSPGFPSLTALASYIQQVSDALREVNAANQQIGIALPESLAPFILADPVDPLLIEAREITARSMERAGNFKTERIDLTRAGGRDDDIDVQSILTALKRGMELAGGQP